MEPESNHSPPPNHGEAEAPESEELLSRRTAIKRIATIAMGFLGTALFLGCETPNGGGYGDSYGNSYGDSYRDYSSYGYSSYDDYYSSMNDYYSNNFSPAGGDGYHNFYGSYDAYSSHDYR